MRNLVVLDCTLRDGGYVNNWNFGKENIISINDKLSQSGIEIVECGFISQKKSTDENKSIFSCVSDAEKYLPKNVDTKFAAMINYGEYDVDDLEDYNGGPLNTLRVAFHKKDLVSAVEMCQKIREKGYDSFVQPMLTLTYSDEELAWLVDRCNEFLPRALYIVDSFGTMTKDDLIKLYNVFEEELDTKIAIGFHSHNNMQLSFSNAQELMNSDSTHEIIVDSSVYGMGRGAGNLCSELITKYVNDNYNGKYNIIPILELIDEQLMPIFLRTPWGYSVPFYVASINKCHPNYASYLLERQTLRVKDIHKILSKIEDEKRVNFDKAYIRDLYEKYQGKQIDDSKVYESLKAICKDRKILVLAPGSSLQKNQAEIIEFCKNNNPLIFSVNFTCDEISSDYIFVGNQKRFEHIETGNKNVIITSNIQSENQNNIVVNYSKLLNENEYISDNSGMMLLNLLVKIGATDVFLAGFDGFSENVLDNYYREKLISGSTKDDLIKISSAIQEKIKELKQTMNIIFITDSIYN